MNDDDQSAQNCAHMNLTKEEYLRQFALDMAVQITKNEGLTFWDTLNAAREFYKFVLEEASDGKE